MYTMVNVENMPYHQRLDTLRAAKLHQTREQPSLIGSLDHDDHA